MSATDPIRDQIIDAIVTALEGITTDNGYNATIDRVLHGGESPVDKGDRVVAIEDQGDTNERMLGVARQADMTLVLRMPERDEHDAGERRLALEQVKSDATKVVMADRRWGDLAVTTRIPAGDVNQYEPVTPMGTALLTVVVTYRVHADNPYQVSVPYPIF
jgi:hypothetical protein